MNYSPRNYKDISDEVRTISDSAKEVEGSLDELMNDISSEDINLPSSSKNISKPLSQISSSTNQVNSVLASFLVEDLSEKLNIYKIMVEHKQESDTFPIEEWFEEASRSDFLGSDISVVTISELLLDSIKEINNYNVDIAKENFAWFCSYFNKFRSTNNKSDIVANIATYPNRIVSFFESNFNQNSNKIEFLKCQSHGEYLKVLNGGRIENIQENSLMYEFARSDIKANIVATKNEKLAFETFEKTDYWKEISKTIEGKGLFIKSLTKSGVSSNILFKEKLSSSYRLYTPPPSSLCIDNCIAFVETFFKNDVGSTEFLIKLIAGKYGVNKEKDKAEEELSILLKIPFKNMLDEKLEKYEPNNPTKVMKI